MRYWDVLNLENTEYQRVVNSEIDIDRIFNTNIQQDLCVLRPRRFTELSK